jgi:hypothetical protein
MIEVGMPAVAPGGVGRLFVRLIVSPPVAVVGTVITTGDQTADVVAAGFNGAHFAVEPATAVPQL